MSADGTPNPCCDHPLCRPASYSVGPNPHRCTVTPFERCKAYAPGRGCVTPARTGFVLARIAERGAEWRP